MFPYRNRKRINDNLKITSNLIKISKNEKKHFIQLAAVALLAACTSNDEPPLKPAKPIDLNETQTRAIEASNSLAWEMAFALQGDDNQENFFFSPLSAFMSLGMLANSAEEPTQVAWANLMGGNDVDLKSINSLFKKLIFSFNDIDETSPLICENLLAVPSAEGVSQSFAETIYENYKGSILKSGEPGKILLYSHLNFSGNLSRVFSQKNTKTTTFQNANGESVEIPMMHCAKIDGLVSSWGEISEVQAFSFHLGNGAFDMTLYLNFANKEGFNLKRNLSKIPNISDMGERATIALPRFSFEGSQSITDGLSKCGISEIFNNKTKFPALGVEGSSIEMGQAYKFDVSEQSINMSNGNNVLISNTPQTDNILPLLNMVCDHPFAFVIKENSTGAILFIGVVNKL